jgi:hypothetical protein
MVCLGADISLLSVFPESGAAKSSSQARAKSESLRVTMVHGDIVVLSGSKFEARNIQLFYFLFFDADPR